MVAAADVRGGGGGFGGAGGGSNGPLVLPGTYNVALLVDGKAVMTKPIKIVGDPMMQMTEAQRKRYYDVAMELHDMQRRGDQMATALNSLGAQLTDADAKLKDSKATSAEKTQFATFKTDFDALQAKFAAPAGGGGQRWTRRWRRRCSGRRRSRVLARLPAARPGGWRSGGWPRRPMPDRVRRKADLAGRRVRPIAA